MQMVGTNPEVNGQTYERPYIEKGEQRKSKLTCTERPLRIIVNLEKEELI